MIKKNFPEDLETIIEYMMFGLYTFVGKYIYEIIS